MPAGHTAVDIQHFPIEFHHLCFPAQSSNSRPGAEFSARRAKRRTLASIHPIHSRSGRTPCLSDRFPARRGRRSGEQAACLSGAPAPRSTHLRLPFPRLFPWLVVRPLLSPAVTPFGKLALLVVAMFGGMRVVHSARIAVHRSLLHVVGSYNRQQNLDPTESITRHSHATPLRSYQKSTVIRYPID